MHESTYITLGIIQRMLCLYMLFEIEEVNEESQILFGRGEDGYLIKISFAAIDYSIQITNSTTLTKPVARVEAKQPPPSELKGMSQID